MGLWGTYYNHINHLAKMTDFLSRQGILCIILTLPGGPLKLIWDKWQHDFGCHSSPWLTTSNWIMEAARVCNVIDPKFSLLYSSCLLSKCHSCVCTTKCQGLWSCYGLVLFTLKVLTEIWRSSKPPGKDDGNGIGCAPFYKRAHG